ncbi:MAG: hypothetical protein HOP24_08200 [Sideroxydans sp.]|nr:hypothetical protein [Sideroxydans sp.]
MNKKYILFHLNEAFEELQSTIAELGAQSDYDNDDYVVAMSHLYHHINTAWNARNASESDSAECSEENFRKWRRFPKSDELLLDE